MVKAAQAATITGAHLWASKPEFIGFCKGLTSKHYVAWCDSLHSSLLETKHSFLENPSNSWVWQVPAIQRLIRHPAVHLIRVDQCQYNQQWRKPTKLLFWNVCPAHLKVCSGKGRCSRTNRAHLQLTGLVGKRFLTQHAQVYTKEFAAALMQSFMHPPPPPSMGHF